MVSHSFLSSLLGSSSDNLLGLLDDLLSGCLGSFDGLVSSLGGNCSFGEMLLVKLHAGLSHEYGLLSAERCTVRHGHFSEDLVETDFALVLSGVSQDSGSGIDAGSKGSLDSVVLLFERGGVLADSNLSPDTVLPSSAAKSENSAHHGFVRVMLSMVMSGAAGSSNLSAIVSDDSSSGMDCLSCTLSGIMSMCFFQMALSFS